jgi:hypothetical protein
MIRAVRVAMLAVLIANLCALPVNAQRPAPAYDLPPADREFVAGVSYRDALTGGLFLAGTALVVGALTGSLLTSATAAVAVAGAYVLFEPGNSRFTSKIDVPTLPQLRGGKLPD